MDNERKGLWLGGQPYWLAIICCLLCLIPMYIPKGEGMVQTTDMTGTLAICFGLAVILNEVGERIPIWNTYIGGGLLLTFFGVAILRQFELIPQAGLDAINSFISDDANFLTFFIVMLIVGSVLGLEKDILLKSFAGYVPAILGGLACAAILGGITAGLCMANRGGNGDLACLGAADRMDLIAYSQLSSRLGGGIVLIIASFVFSFLL